MGRVRSCHEGGAGSLDCSGAALAPRVSRRRPTTRSGRARFLPTLGAGLISCLAAISASAQIAINEVDYDQSGTDTADFVELFEPGKTGLSLAGWELALYNGTASQRSPYLTISLSAAPGGVMPPDGYLVIGPAGIPEVDITLPSGGWIQNGSPDGMALVSSGLVVELWAYEGSFVGASGPAAGMTFEDIEVAEQGGDGLGLQRLPDGGAWAAIPEAARTPGEPNPEGWGVIAYGGLTTMHLTDGLSGPIALCADGGTPPYVLTIISLPSYGDLSDDGGAITVTPAVVSGALIFAPDPGFSGVDTFEFTARDDMGLTSFPAVQEIGVQQGVIDVVISEVMRQPSGDQRAFEYVEIHNPTAQTVSLGRLDSLPPLSANTVDNLAGQTIPPGATRILAPDARAESLELELLRCEWGLLETEIIRVALANWELLPSVSGIGCATPEPSRLLLYDSSGNLLDAVYLVDLAPGGAVWGESLSIDDQLLPPPGGPLNTDNNDLIAPWIHAGEPGVPGIRTSASGDLGGPMFVPSLSVSPYLPTYCTGRCCQSGELCEELTEDDCGAAGGDLGRWAMGTTCDDGWTVHQAFLACLAGPDVTVASGCFSHDRDSDTDVDLRDFGAWQREFSLAPCP